MSNMSIKLNYSSASHISDFYFICNFKIGADRAHIFAKFIDDDDAKKKKT